MVDFGQQLQALRLRDGLTQWQLAEQLNLTQSAISAYETCLRLPSYDVLLKLSRIFKVSTDYLLGASLRTDSTLDLSGLTEPQKAALRQLVDSMRC